MTPNRLATAITDWRFWPGSSEEREFNSLTVGEQAIILALVRTHYARLLRADATFPVPPPDTLAGDCLAEAL